MAVSARRRGDDRRLARGRDLLYNPVKEKLALGNPHGGAAAQVRENSTFRNK